MAAAGLAYAKAAVRAGLDEATALSRVAIGVAADAEYFNLIAKLRAARIVWTKLVGAITDAPVQTRIEARSSRRMLSRLDPWVNMLRLTAAGFGAAAGGADAIVLEPFTQPLGRPTPFARRQARNTQLVLMEEAHLGRVADPAAGAWFIETLTDEIARKAWAFFQAIEAAGGLVEALSSGMVSEAVGAARNARMTDLAKRKTGLVGVSEFPNLLEGEVQLDAINPAPFRKTPPRIAMPGPDGACPPLAPWRASSGFETLRERARASGKAPAAFLAMLGEPRDYTARLGFARNLLAAGGMAVETGEAAAYQAAGAPIAVICSSDEVYAGGAAADAARVLKARGAKRIYLAGRPSEREGELKAAGIDAFLYAGGDVMPWLEDMLAICGDQATGAHR